MSVWKKLKRDNLKAFLDEISLKAELWIPENINGKWKFAIYDSEKDTNFPENIIDKSVKELFFPKRRTIGTFDTKGKWNLNPIETSTEPRVIMGIRSCDVKAISYRDKVFSENKYNDALYIAERKRTILIGMVCDSMGETCHCTDRGISPDDTENMDLVFSGTEESYLFKQISEKGKGIFHSKYLVETDDVPEKKDWPKDRFKVASPEEMIKMYDDELWEDISDICLTCGACTFECPTCTCFMVSDEKFKDKGERITVWDTCQFSSYSRMAGGHNPRIRNLDRVRNRTLDKFAYSYQRYGVISCTGCGRCVIVCPLKRSFPHIAAELTDKIQKKAENS